MEARKLPAAPALLGQLVNVARLRTRSRKDIHHIVNGTELLDTALDGIVQVLELSHINGTDANNLGPWACRGDILSHALCLLYIATDDAGVGSKVNQRANLSTANSACATCAEDDLVGWKEESVIASSDMAEGGSLPKMPSFQMSLMYSVLGRGMMKCVIRQDG